MRSKIYERLMSDHRHRIYVQLEPIVIVPRVERPKRIIIEPVKMKMVEPLR